MNASEKGHITMSGLLVGAAVGAVVGAGVALLFAPKTGKETRKWLGAKAGALKGKLGETLERAPFAGRRDVHELNAAAASTETPTH